jgi:WD40 repeat protein
LITVCDEPPEQVEAEAAGNGLSKRDEDEPANSARVWEVAQPQKPSRVLTHREAVLYATFDREGQRVVTTSVDDTGRLWNLATGEVGKRLVHSSDVTFAAFAPDGERVITAGLDGTARVWDVEGCTPLFNRPLRHRLRVRQARFSNKREHECIVTSGDDGAIALWDTVSGHPLIPPLMHSGQVERVFVHSGEDTARTRASRCGR